VWCRTNGVLSFAAASSVSSVDLLLNFRNVSGAFTIGTTVMRTHLNLEVFSSVTLADTFSYGVMRGPKTLAGAGIAGCPNPNTDLEEDWAWWDSRVATKTANFPGYWSQGDNSTVIDIRAKRKIDELNTTWLFIANPAVSTVVPFQVQVTASVLLALP